MLKISITSNDQEKYVEFIVTEATKFVSSLFKHSYSGFIEKINRPLFGTYIEPLDSTEITYGDIYSQLTKLERMWNKHGATMCHPNPSNADIKTLMSKDDHEMNQATLIEAFDCILKTSTSNCKEMSYLLALILKSMQFIDNMYHITIMFKNEDAKSKIKAHVFVCLIPKSCPVNNVYRSRVMGHDILQMRDILFILDPWQNKVFHGDNLTSSVNPLNQPGTAWVCPAQFETIKFQILSVEVFYFDKFSTYWEAKLAEIILQNTPHDPFVKAIFKDTLDKKQYELLLRKASVSDKFLNVARIILLHRTLLKVNIFAKGEKSKKSALDLAREIVKNEDGTTKSAAPETESLIMSYINSFFKYREPLKTAFAIDPDLMLSR